MRQVERDGVALCYEEAGEGKPPVLLVHGWCCDHTYFAPQVEHFAQRGHRVVAVDLRGHGESDKPRQRYSMQVFADDLAWMCERLDFAQPVVVGHSMGGIVAFDLAARYPGLTSAVVMLDAAVVLPSVARAAIPASSRSCAVRATESTARLRGEPPVHPGRRPRAQGAYPGGHAFRPAARGGSRLSRGCATTTPLRLPGALRCRPSTSPPTRRGRALPWPASTSWPQGSCTGRP